ncbi:MAG: class I SAM-dependent methyltransferase [Clostridium sp.]|nr:class I SAM-dependent methyltransferase [Clostridium sp.]
MFEIIFDSLPNRLLLKSLENKKIFFYGAGQLAEEMFNIVDFSKSEIIGISDKRFTEHKPENFCSVRTYNTDEISDLDFDVFFISVLQAKKLKKCLMQEEFYKLLQKKKCVIRYFNIFSYIFKEKFGQKSDDRCIFCSHTGMREFCANIAPFLSYLMFDNKEKKTKLLYCPHCSVSYFKLRPNEEQVAKYYKDRTTDNFIKLRQKFEPFIMEVLDKHPSYDLRLNQIKKCLEPIGRIFNDSDDLLDYGGNALFLRDLYPNANKFSLDKTHNEAQNDVNVINSLSEVKEKFSFIMSTQVFEHLSYPADVLSTLHSSLKKDGFLYISVPDESGFNNDNSFFNRILGKTNLVMHEHINIYNPKSLKMLFEKCGFEVIKCKSVALKNYLYKGYIYVLARKI